MIITQKIGDAVTHRIAMRWQRARFVPAGGFILTFTLKAAASDADDAALIQKRSGGYGVVESGSLALVSFLPPDTAGSESPVIAPLDPGSYVFDLQAQSATDPDDVRTVAEGVCVLGRDIFRGTETAIPIYVAEPPLGYDNELITYE